MAIKAEISWHRKDSEGIKVEVYARRFGGSWTFYSRYRRHEDWQPLKPAPLEDWLELRDAIIRRIPRGLFPPDELKRVEADIRNRFPKATF